MASFSQSFKHRAVARLLPHEGASLAVVSAELGLKMPTLERWLDQAQTQPALRGLRHFCACSIAVSA